MPTGSPFESTSLGDIVATLPLIALGVVIMWLTLAVSLPGAEAGQGPAGAARVPHALQSQPSFAGASGQLVIIAVPDERVAATAGMFAAESAFRALIGEPERQAVVVGAPDDAAAEQVAQALREDFGQFSALSFGAVIVH